MQFRKPCRKFFAKIRKFFAHKSQNLLKFLFFATIFFGCKEWSFGNSDTEVSVCPKNCYPKQEEKFARSARKRINLIAFDTENAF